MGDETGAIEPDGPWSQAQQAGHLRVRSSDQLHVEWMQRAEPVRPRRQPWLAQLPADVPADVARRACGALRVEPRLADPDAVGVVGPVRRDLVDDRVHARSPGADADLGHARLAAHDVVDDRRPPRGSGPSRTSTRAASRGCPGRASAQSALPARDAAHRSAPAWRDMPESADAPVRPAARRDAAVHPGPARARRPVARSGTGRWQRREATDLVATATLVDTGLTLIETFDVGFAGFGGNTVKGWLHLPSGAKGPLPAVVEFVGYGGGRGLPHERVAVGRGGLRPLRDGHARPGLDVVASARRPTRTRPARPFHPGFMTRGILAPAGLLLPAGLRRWRARGRGRPAAPARSTASRVAVTGGSQGGGISLAVAALVARHRRRHARRAVPVRLPARDHAAGQGSVRARSAAT